MTTLTATRSATTTSHDTLTADQTGIRDPRLQALMGRVKFVEAEQEPAADIMLVDGTDMHLAVQLGRGLFLGTNDDLAHVDTTEAGYRILRRASDNAEIHVGVHRTAEGLVPVVFQRGEDGVMRPHEIVKRIRNLRNGDGVGAWSKFHYALTTMINARTFVVIAPTEAYRVAFEKAMEIGFVSEASYVEKRVAKAAAAAAAPVAPEVAAVKEAGKPFKKLGSRDIARYERVIADLTYRGLHAEAAQLDKTLRSLVS